MKLTISELTLKAGENITIYHGKLEIHIDIPEKGSADVVLLNGSGVVDALNFDNQTEAIDLDEVAEMVGMERVSDEEDLEYLDPPVEQATDLSAWVSPTYGSTTVDAIRFIHPNMLDIRFHSGSAYRYDSDVDVYYELLSASSPGHYYTRHIKGVYTSEKLSEPSKILADDLRARRFRF